MEEVVAVDSELRSSLHAELIVDCCRFDLAEEEEFMWERRACLR